MEELARRACLVRCCHLAVHHAVHNLVRHLRHGVRAELPRLALVLAEHGAANRAHFDGRRELVIRQDRLVDAPVHLHPDYSLAQKEELSQKFKEATTASEKKTLMEKWNYEFHGSDLAVIEFGEDVFEGTPLELAAADPMVGEKVQLVGFGYNSLAEKVGSGIKRWGQDVISEVKTHMLVTYGDVLYQLDPEAGETSTAGGDSGGPLLNSENKIQGVLSLGQKVWWDGQIQNRSIYVKTTSEKSQAFLKGFLE